MQESKSQPSSWRSVLSKAVGPMKWLFAGALLWFTIQSGKIDFELLGMFIKKPHVAIISIAIVFVWYGLTFLRWKLLLKSQSIPISFFKAFQLGMMGQFFMTFAPGTVGGDVAKGLYICKRYPSQRVRALSSVFLDRALGLYAILSLGAISFLMGYTNLSKLESPLVPLINSLGTFLVFIFIAGVVALILFPVISRKILKLDISNSAVDGFWKTKFRSLREVFLQYGDKPGVLWTALILSFMSHSLGVLVLYFVAYQFFGPEPLSTLSPVMFYLASVLGLTAMALPISPMGLGVGQVAFASVFSAFGIGSESFGASIVTGLQLITLLANLCGALFFITHKNEAIELESLVESGDDSIGYSTR